jgi:hypothetical protein
MFGGAPPAPAPRRRKAAAAQPASSPAAGPQVMQVVHAEQPQAQMPQPGPSPLRQYRQVTLHDGRQVDSGSEEWKLECLARTLLQLGPAEQYEWISGYGTADDQRALRMRMSAIKASANAGLKER